MIVSQTLLLMKGDETEGRIHLIFVITWERNEGREEKTQTENVGNLVLNKQCVAQE